MTAQHATCPPDAALSDFGLGKLDVASADSVSQHLEICADCRQRVASVSGDSFVGRLREARPKAAVRARTFVPGESLAGRGQHSGVGGQGFVSGESLANAANSTDGSMLPRQGGPKATASVAAPPELANHPDFELVKELGQGGMGTVYLAKNRMMDRLEVLKVISTALLDRPGALERFQQEIRSAAKLNHPNIVAAHSVSRPGNLLVFAMEYVRGQDLAQVVKARGALPVANAAFYTHQVALGLQHAHEKGMVHRDIKPNNLMLTIEGKKHVVKILDFGLSKATSEKGAESGLTKNGQMLGTPDYIAPEQTLDAHQADIRADIYSLGCTLYALLSGGPPFQESSLYGILEAHQKREARPLNLVRPEVPAELAAVVSKMMAKQPAKRYQTPQEVAKALVPFFKRGQSVPPSSPTNAPHLPSTGETADAMAATTPPPLVPPPIAPPLPLVPRAVMPVAVADTAESVDHFSLSIDTQRAAPARSKRSTARGTLRMPGLPRYGWAILAGLLPAVVLLMAGLVFSFKTSEGTVVVEVNVENPEISIDGDRATVTWDDGGKRAEISLAPGTHEIELTKDGFKAYGEKVVIEKGGEALVSARLKPVKAMMEKPNALSEGDSSGFLPLFNGKDLTGWRPVNSHAINWAVEGGVLVGRGHGPPGRTNFGQLVTEATDYSNFHLRAEFVHSEPQSSSLRFRVGPGNELTSIDGKGYGVHIKGIDQTRTDKIQLQTGALRKPGVDAVSDSVLASAPRADYEAGRWFTLEVIAVENRFRVKINSQEIVDVSDLESSFSAGRIGLVCRPASTIKFRKIEIRELGADGQPLDVARNASSGDRQASNTPPRNTATDLKIVEARWGTGQDWVDVTAAMRAGIRDGRYLATVEAVTLGGKDPAYGVRKQLIVRYQFSEQSHTATFNDGEVIYLAPERVPGPPSNDLTLIEAKYGGGNVWVDVLDRMKPLVKHNLLTVDADLSAYVDPRPGAAKALLVRYALNGEIGSVSVRDHEVLCVDARPPVTINGRINLLELIEPKRDAIRGEWQLIAGRLRMPAINLAQLNVPRPVPVEYELTAVVECAEQKDCLIVGLPVGGSIVALTIDSSLRTSGLSDLDGEWCGRNAATRHGRFLREGSPNTIVCRVQKGTIEVSCNDATVIDWTGDPRQLAVSNSWEILDPRHLFLAGYATSFEISKLELSPLLEKTAAASSPPTPPIAAKKSVESIQTRESADDMEASDESDEEPDSETGSPEADDMDGEKESAQKPRKQGASRRPAKPIDLLKQLNLKQPGTVGEWRMEKGRLVFPQVVLPSLAIFDTAPEEYTLRATVLCPSHVGALSFGIVVAASQATVVIDGQGKQSSALGLIDGREGKDNATRIAGTSLFDGAPNHVEITVRKNRVQVSCNRRQLIDWKDNPSSLSLPAAFAGRHGAKQLFISMGQPSPFVVTNLTLQPLRAANDKPAKSARERKADARRAEASKAFAPGSVWKGKRTYQHGTFSAASVTYELHVTERDGGKFKGHVFDNGPNRNRADVEGEIDGTTLTWRERPLHMAAVITMEGTLDRDKIKLTFKGSYPGGGTNDGDGELTREGADPADDKTSAAPSPPKTDDKAKHALRGPRARRAVAPFNADQARALQEGWAKHLGVAVEQKNSIAMPLVLLPPGDFTMGSTPEQTAEAKKRAEQAKSRADRWTFDRLQNEAAHRVKLSHPFLMGATEVTVGQFRRFVDATGYVTQAEQFGGGDSGNTNEQDANKKKLTWRTPGCPTRENSNVSQVSWNDAVAFCNWLSETEKLAPCYRSDRAGGWALSPSRKGYRLPTEAEWEYACRAGTTTQYSFGDDSAAFGRYGWSSQAGALPRPLAVAAKVPNAFGLYDMHGNAYEWCHDWFAGNYYSVSPAVDPTGPPTGSDRVRRGGSFYYPLVVCRSAFRAPCPPVWRYNDLGFRVVRLSVDALGGAKSAEKLTSSG